MPHIWMTPPVSKDFCKHHLIWRCNHASQCYCGTIWEYLIPISERRKLRLWKNKRLAEGYITHQWSQFSMFMSSHQAPCSFCCASLISPGLNSTAKQSRRSSILRPGPKLGSTNVYSASTLYLCKATSQTSLKDHEAVNCPGYCFLKTKYIMPKQL